MSGVEKDSTPSPVLEKVEPEYVTEKLSHNSSDDAVNQFDKAAFLEGASDEDGVRVVNGEPVITTGADVSKYLLTLRDDEDPSLTFRSIVLGTVFAGLGAAMCQACSPIGPCCIHG